MIWRSDIELGRSGDGKGLEGWLRGPVSGGGRGGAVLGGVGWVWCLLWLCRMCLPLGSCVVFITVIGLGLGGSRVDGVAGRLVFLTCVILPLILSCLLL